LRKEIIVGQRLRCYRDEMRFWFASLILMFAILAAGTHASALAHDHLGNTLHSHDVAASDHHSDDADDHDSDAPAPDGMNGDVVSHFHMPAALVGAAPIIPDMAEIERQPRLHGPGKVLVSRSYRPPIQPPSA
jgi:hypothetical protein